MTLGSSLRPLIESAIKSPLPIRIVRRWRKVRKKVKETVDLARGAGENKIIESRSIYTVWV